METIRIAEIKESDKKLVEAVGKLLDQLVSTPIDFTEEDLLKIINSPSSQLFFIYFEGQIAGMLTLGHYVSPTGTKYWVEDVVVDRAFRGKSFGRKLIEFAIKYVKDQGSSTLMLTSKPSRIAANRLYQSVGFQSKETNVYKLDFKDEASTL